MLWGRDNPISRHPGVFVILLAVAIVVSAGLASAHQLTGSRFNAPLPLWLLFVGAGATVAATALLLGLIDTVMDRSTTSRSTSSVSVPAFAR